MTSISTATPPQIAHAEWLREKAADFRRLAAGAIPLAVAQDLDRLAYRYERLAAALKDCARGDASTARDSELVHAVPGGQD